MLHSSAQCINAEQGQHNALMQKRVRATSRIAAAWVSWRLAHSTTFYYFVLHSTTSYNSTTINYSTTFYYSTAFYYSTTFSYYTTLY